MVKDENCIFCRIVSEELPRIEVFEDFHTLAFMDINPIAPGHVLIISKKHSENLYDTPDEQLSHVVASVKRVAKGVRKALNPDGVSLIQANGKGAAQSVLHFHIHVVPRTTGDELKINWDLEPGDMDEICSIAKCIIKELE